MPDVKLPYEWAPRDYQIPAWRALERGARMMSLRWHRRAGKDDFGINATATQAMKRIGTYWHLLPYYKQGRQIIWDGITFTGRPYRAAFPRELVVREREDEMCMWLAPPDGETVGSIWRVVGADNIDSIVGTNPIGIVASEFPLMDPRVLDYLSPILAQNGGWFLDIGTPRGKNHAYHFHNRAIEGMKTDPSYWFAETLTVDDTRCIAKVELEREKARMAPDVFAQEYFCSTSAPLEGAFYGELIRQMERENRVTNVPYDPQFPVTTSWDLGQGDDNPICFWQQVGREIRLIDCHEASGKGFDYYSKILHEKPYSYDYHLAPHDINVREFSGKSRIAIAADHNIRFSIVPKLSIEDGHNAVRMLLPRLWVDQIKCERVIQALREYVRVRDQHSGDFTNSVKKNWAVHLADSVRYFAIGMKPPRRASSGPIYAKMAMV